MSYPTNGFLVTLIEDTAKNMSHASNGDAGAYLAAFRAMESIFFEKVHPLVDMGLAIREVQIAQGGKPHIFTIHGCRHIVDVIKSLDKLAEAIADDPGGRLSVLEAYILLCAAHVHDGANVKQREGHPQRCNELIAEYKVLFANTAAIQQIYDVASVHGGKHPEYGKDTLRSLDLSNTESPRLPMLAAILRIGDELSENPERVPALVANSHEHSDASKLAFAYARSFQQFELRKDSLYLNYGVYPESAAITATVDGHATSFFDFLEAKLDAIDREARYCSQYGRPHLHIARITVTIRLYEYSSPSLVKTNLTFSWRLLDGYPRAPEPICSRSPDLKGRGLKKLAQAFVERPAPVSGWRAWLRARLG